MFNPFSLNIAGRLVWFHRPAVMGVINVTPDSFYAGSRQSIASDAAMAAMQMLHNGADIIDIGACSTRPGAEDVSASEELERLIPAVEAIREAAPECLLSVDTFRAEVAHAALEHGANIINDITGGDADPAMVPLVARKHVPYIFMHMRGTPLTLATMTDYPDGVVAEVLRSLAEKLRHLSLEGVCDVIADPGFGFPKTLEQSYELLDNLELIAEALDVPLLAGISRKSMVTTPLGIAAEDALAGTTVLNTIALLHGASVLRVHDVAAARQAITLLSHLPSCGIPT